MQRERDDRDGDHRDHHDRDRDRGYDRERERFPPPPDRTLYRSASFMSQRLPPNPRHYYSQSPNVVGSRELPSPTGGLTDPKAWSSSALSPSGPGMPPSGSPIVGPSDQRPGSSRGHHWSPTSAISPRFNDRLPSIQDFAPSPGPGSAGHTIPSAPPGRFPWEGGLAPGSFQREPSREDMASSNAELLGSAPEPQDDSVMPSSRSSSAAKHPAPPTDEQPRKKKRRQAFSCAECAKRKQKCNRETPCQHCVSRKVPHLCVPSSRMGSPPPRPKAKTEPSDPRKPGTIVDERPGSSGSMPAMGVRVTKLEKIMNAVLNKVNVQSSALTEWRQLHAVAKSPPPERPPAVPLPNGPTATATSGASSGEYTDSWSGAQHSTATTRKSLPLVNGQPLGVEYQPTIGEQLESIVDEGVTASLQKFISDLPPKSLSDKLVDFYFDKINHIRYAIDQRLFRRAYDAVHASQSDVSLTSLLALPLIFAVLATAMQVAPLDWIGSEETRRKRSLKLVWSSTFGLQMSNALNAESLQLVEARIVLGMLLVCLHDLRLQGWAMFRGAATMAIAMVLHREPSRLPLDPYVVEYRREIWAHLCHADVTLSVLLGRPLSVIPTYHDTQPPSNVSLHLLQENVNTIEAQPMNEPTTSTYLVLRRRLADIVASIVVNFQTTYRTPDYDKITALSTDLTKFRDSLPPHFRMDDPDKSQDETLVYLPVQRYILRSEILHYMIILHRPWILRQIRGDRYAASRKACFEAALAQSRLRKAIAKDVPDFLEPLVVDAAMEFDVALMACISVLLDSASVMAKDMMDVISSYVENQSVEQAKKPQSEIIRALFRRAKALRSPVSSAMPLASPSHPLDNLSSERHRAHPGLTRGMSSSSSTADVGATLSSATAPDSGHGLRKPASESAQGNEDQAQSLLDQYVAANSEMGRWSPILHPADRSPTAPTGSLLGMIGVGPPPNTGAGASMITTLNDSSIASGSTSSSSLVDIYSSQYWNNFADVLAEQVGQA